MDFHYSFSPILLTRHGGRLQTRRKKIYLSTRYCFMNEFFHLAVRLKEVKNLHFYESVAFVIPGYQRASLNIYFVEEKRRKKQKRKRQLNWFS